MLIPSSPPVTPIAVQKSTIFHLGGSGPRSDHSLSIAGILPEPPCRNAKERSKKIPVDGWQLGRVPIAHEVSEIPAPPA